MPKINGISYFTLSWFGDKQKISREEEINPLKPVF
jgi:hypothetical protein